MYDPKEMIDTRYSDEEIQKDIANADFWMDDAHTNRAFSRFHQEQAKIKIMYNQMIEHRFMYYCLPSLPNYAADILPDAYDQERKIPDGNS